MRDKAAELARLRELEAATAGMAKHLGAAHESLEKMNRAAEANAQVLASWVKAFQVVVDCDK